MLLTSTSQNYQCHKNQSSLRTCHSQEESKKTQLLNVIWKPGQDPGKEHEHWVKGKDI